jgi:DNA/RNA endonuclease G (NUC1)
MKKNLIIIIIIIYLSLSVFASETKVRRQYLPEFQEGDIILNKKYFTICFNPKTNVAKWVIYKISDSILSTKLDLDRPTSPRYPQDPDYIVLPKDVYTSTGYDSGHLAPAGDFKFNEKAYFDTFYVTNMSPQYGGATLKAMSEESGQRTIKTLYSI